VYIEAGRTKSGRDDSLPLAPDVLELLKSRRREAGPVFTESPTRRTFKQDLSRAGIGYDGPRGQADRKCLRKTFGTHLAMAGVDFRLAVRLMRHKDPKLTQNIYTDPMLLDMKGAVARISEQAIQKRKSECG
jgi:integrase